jgi:hypothetical protein
MKKLVLLIVGITLVAGQAWGSSTEGTYRSKDPESTLTISKARDGKYKFDFFGAFKGNNGMVNTGTLEFEEILSSKVTYTNPPDESECKLEIIFINPKVIKVNQIEGSCGAGMNVYYGGTYKKAKKK